MADLDLTVRHAAAVDLDATTLYRILALRVDVFVVEQDCAYREIDGRDLEPHATLWWAERDGHVLATLRWLVDPDGRARIGRVATAAQARGQGLAGRLVHGAIDDDGGRCEIRLDAQSHLARWYARFGFVRCGPDFLEDDIPHTPMLRAGGPLTVLR